MSTDLPPPAAKEPAGTEAAGKEPTTALAAPLIADGTSTVESAAAAAVAPAVPPPAVAEVVIEAAATPTTTEPRIEIPAETPTLPAVATEVPVESVEASDSPVPGAPVPPSFLRDHATRIIAKRIARAEIPAPTPIPAPLRPSEPATPAVAAASKDKPQRSRFPLLAASLALAATLGAAGGTLGSTGLLHVLARPEPAPVAAKSPRPDANASAEIAALKAVVTRLSAEITAVKANVDHASKSTSGQFARLNEKLDRTERQQAEPAAKLAKMIETLERLERRATATTAAAAPAPAPANDVTGSIAPMPLPAPQAKKNAPLPVIDRYVLLRVYDGIALIEGRRGAIEVEPGMNVPGAGKVEEIRRQDGRWVVLTTKGIIVSAR